MTVGSQTPSIARACAPLTSAGESCLAASGAPIPIIVTVTNAAVTGRVLIRPLRGPVRVQAVIACGAHATHEPERSLETDALQFFDFATRRASTVADNLGWVGFGLSASRDGRTVFFSRIDSSIHELTVVDDFR